MRIGKADPSSGRRRVVNCWTEKVDVERYPPQASGVMRFLKLLLQEYSINFRSLVARFERAREFLYI